MEKKNCLMLSLSPKYFDKKVIRDDSRLFSVEAEIQEMTQKLFKVEMKLQSVRQQALKMTL